MDPEFTVCRHCGTHLRGTPECCSVCRENPRGPITAPTNEGAGKVPRVRYHEIVTWAGLGILSLGIALAVPFTRWWWLLAPVFLVGALPAIVKGRSPAITFGVDPGTGRGVEDARRFEETASDLAMRRRWWAPISGACVVAVGLFCFFVAAKTDSQYRELKQLSTVEQRSYYNNDGDTNWTDDYDLQWFMISGGIIVIGARVVHNGRRAKEIADQRSTNVPD